MKRDMDLIRIIMLKIEEEFETTALVNLKVEKYSNDVVAMHCKLLYEAGLVSFYKSQYAENELSFFTVGNLTWDGYDYLDKIRDDSIWRKVKDTIKKQGLPLIIETVKQISSAIISTMTQNAINGM